MPQKLLWTLWIFLKNIFEIGLASSRRQEQNGPVGHPTFCRKYSSLLSKKSPRGAIGSLWFGLSRGKGVDDVSCDQHSSSFINRMPGLLFLTCPTALACFCGNCADSKVGSFGRAVRIDLERARFCPSELCWVDSLFKKQRVRSFWKAILYAFRVYRLPPWKFRL